MSLYVKPELKTKGRENFRAEAAEMTRRGFMKSMALGTFGLGAVGAAVYFGYSRDAFKDKGPVRAALIGAGDEGGVLVGEHNPDFLRFVAVCDLRPSNQERIFKGEDPKPNQTEADVVRKGFRRIEPYGADCRKKIETFDTIPQLLGKIDELQLEAVVIALPLHLHAPVAIQCMKAGLNVLCEKLMAWNIKQCKEMIEVGRHKDVVLSIGHQRHYSMLYAHATELIKAGTLGEIRHIRALWHRNNAKPKHGSDGSIIENSIADGWMPDIKPEDAAALADSIELHGYEKRGNRTALEELVRWRLYNTTGAGLMAELGSHQLDACSIFLQASTSKVRGDEAPAKVHPLAVTGVGGKYFYRDERDIDDHVFVTFEFPGPHYWKDAARTEVKDKDDIVAVTYSSINTNAFEPYGECIMGSKATMIVEEEREIQLYREQGWDQPAGKGSAVAVTTNTGAPVVSASSSSGPAERVAAGPPGTGASGKASRGYREEMEHFAYCIRMRQAVSGEDRNKFKVRCDGPNAMVDAIIALTANKAIRDRKRIEFDPKWFEPESKEVPDDPAYDKAFLKKYPYG
jgi:predicted dehydrogenase